MPPNNNAFAAEHFGSNQQALWVFSCEHGSNALPVGVVPSAADAAFLRDHWGWDIGARALTAELVAKTGSAAVVAGFSRLWIDPNRAPKQAGLVVRAIDGHAFSFNRDVDVAARLHEYHEPYHQAVDAMLASQPHPVCLVSIHSFAPMYRGQARQLEVGVLFDDYDDDATQLRAALERNGFWAELNEPYSGKPPQGLIYAAKRHGSERGCKYIELEVRNDLLTAEQVPSIAARIVQALATFVP